MRSTQYTIRHFYYSRDPSGKVMPYLSFFEEYSASPLKRCMISPHKVSLINRSFSTDSCSMFAAVLWSFTATLNISYLIVSKPHQGKITKWPRCGFLLVTLKMGSPAWLLI